MSQVIPSPLLRKALRANAIFSAACGVTMAIGFGNLAAWMGLSAAWLLPFLGVGLVGFALLLAWMSTRATLPENLAWAVIAGDLAWVVASVTLLAGFPDFLNQSGNLLVWLIAFVVMLFAVTQFLGLRQSRPG